MKQSGSDFRFFVPLELTKGTDEKGKKVMKIGGIASTSDEDSDGEFLDPEGFDLQYFLKYGFLNWHHQSKTNPAAIVGEPTVAEIRDKKLYIEGELYADSPLAKDIYTLAEALKSSNSGRHLGFSIEGKVTERDAMNPKIVKQAQITGCAITPTPKNSQTLAEIIKGHGADVEDYEFEDSQDANGGNSEFILDITKPTGERITVDKDLNVTIKAMEATGNGASVVRESLGGQVIDTQKIGQKKRKDLTKGEVYGQIFQYLHDADIEKAKDIYTVIETIYKSENNNSMEKTISQEAIDKAFTVLGISKSVGSEDSSDDITKAQDAEASADADSKGEDTAEDYAEDGDKKDAETKANAEKADDEEDLAAKGDMSDEEYNAMKKACEDMSNELSKMKKAMDAYETKKAMGTEGDTMGTAAATEGGTENPGDNVGEVKKGIEGDNVSPLMELIKAENAKVLDSVSALGTIQKALSENFDSLEGRLSAIENSTPGRKSATSAAYIEKGFDKDQNSNNDGITTLSTNLHKAQILDILDSRAGITEHGVANMAFANAMTLYEASGVLKPEIAHRLLVDEKIRVVA
jgi:hypothetical protein